MKKRNTYQQKRTTFLSLLLRGLLAAVIISAAFAFVLREYIFYQIRDQSELQINDVKSEMQRYINYIDSDDSLSDEAKYDLISARLGILTSYDIWVNHFIIGASKYSAEVMSAYSPRGSAVSALVDENDNVKATNKLVLKCIVNLGENVPYNGLYTFKPEMLNSPAADKLKNDIDEFDSRIGMTGYITFEISSIYYDTESRTFVPREGNIQLMRAQNYHDLIFDNEIVVEEERKIDLNLDDSRYKLLVRPFKDTPTDDEQIKTTLYTRMTEPEITPNFGMVSLFGTSDEEYEMYSGYFHFDMQDSVQRVFTRDYAPPDGEGKYTESRSCAVYLSGRQHELFFCFVIDTKDPQITAFFRNSVLAFSAVVLVVTLLLCWRKNVLNKAKYAFEDYQRDLTDSLAHDIKTPLMAISGYAENVLNGKLTEAEQKEYLTSIMDNVSFTDSLISRTLYLNHIDGKSTSKEPIKLDDMIGEIVNKYALLLHGRNIKYDVSGSAEVRADRSETETIMENIISNAVKYTPDGGAIKIEIDKKRLTVTNSVSEKTDTKELKRPFVRGDSARSNTDGNGLGLAIAERAALANGFGLSVSCTDTEFKTELRL